MYQQQHAPPLPRRLLSASVSAKCRVQPDGTQPCPVHHDVSFAPCRCGAVHGRCTLPRGVSPPLLDCRCRCSWVAVHTPMHTHTHTQTHTHTHTLKTHTCGRMLAQALTRTLIIWIAGVDRLAAGRYSVGRALFSWHGALRSAGRSSVGRALFGWHGALRLAGRSSVGMTLFGRPGALRLAGRSSVGQALFGWHGTQDRSIGRRPGTLRSAWRCAAFAVANARLVLRYARYVGAAVRTSGLPAASQLQLSAR